AATIMRWIARTYMNDANADAALDSAEAALQVSEACGDRAGAGYAINAKAAVHWQQGNLDEAERLFLQARSLALAVSDIELAARTSHNLGVMASIRGELTDALEHYNIALENCRAIGLDRDTAHTLNNLGLLHTELQQWSDAERAYSEAKDISTLSGDLPIRISVTVNLAEMWLRRNELPRANASVRRALELAAHSEDLPCMPQIYKLRGSLARKGGDAVEADAHFAHAVALAEARHDFLILAETLRERADLDRDQGRNREALQNLNRAHRLFAELRARRELANVDQSMGRLETDFLEVVRRWGESIEEKDQYTQGHCVRVANLACAIAAAVGIETQELFWFRIGTLLHDVGKLIVPSETLNKVGRLTDEEWVLMRRHPSAGIEMLAGVDFPWDVRPIIESHHERWDGKGYPHGLAGETIPMSARIVALADVYDALTSIRSYKRSLSHDETMAIMREDIGRAFDPTLFARFEEVVGTDEFRRGGSSEIAVMIGTDTASLPAARADSIDELTGLLSRRSLLAAVARLLADGVASPSVALLLVDVNHFKVVNTTFGYQRGDDVLRMVTRELTQQMRLTDILGRYGDDEFVALLPNTPLDEACAIADRVRRVIGSSVSGPPDGELEAVRVSVSVGVAASPLHGSTADELFRCAERALDAAKAQEREGAALGATKERELASGPTASTDATPERTGPLRLLA
ncbi:MAG: HD domain-containing phosphohydrolase, partial [bacterium]